MKKNRLLTKEERAYIIEKISPIQVYKEEFGELDKDSEERLINSIVSKIQALQDLEE